MAVSPAGVADGKVVERAVDHAEPAGSHHAEESPEPAGDGAKHGGAALPIVRAASRGVLEEGERIRTVSLLLLAALASAVALHWLEPVLVPLILALVITFVLQPLAESLMRRPRLPRALAVTLSVLVAVAFLLALVVVVTLCVKEVATTAKVYQGSVKTLGRRFARAHREITDHSARSSLAYLVEHTISDLPIGEFIGRATQLVLNNVADFVARAMLVLVFIIYLLESTTRRTGKTRTFRRGVWGVIEERIRKYVTIKLAVSVANGIAALAFYWFIGADLVFVFSILHFVLNLIPNVGPVIAVAIPIPFLLLDPRHSTLTVVMALIVPTATHLVIGYHVEPVLLGDSLELHPVTVLICLIFWGMLWGIAGLLLACPLTAALKCVLEGFEFTVPLAALMEGTIGEYISGDEPDAERGELKAGGSSLTRHGSLSRGEGINKKS